MKPVSSAFFSFFYLNRDGYSENTMHSKNPVLKLLNWMLIKFWRFIPGTFTILKWNDRFDAKTE